MPLCPAPPVTTDRMSEEPLRPLTGSSPFRLDDRVAFITGAASGIGLAISRRLAAAGATVALADISDASSLAEELDGIAVRCDVADEHQVAAAFEETSARCGRLDIVCNNAGIGDLGGGVADADPAIYRRVFDVNVLGVVHGMKHAVRHLGPGGVIVNTASMAGLMGMPYYGAYTASKWAVVGLTKNAAIELAPARIRVFAVAPSSVRTPMLDESDPETAAEISFVKHAQLTPRPLEPDEVAAAVQFLVADDCAHLTGTILPLDGGLLAGPALDLLTLASGTPSS